MALLAALLLTAAACSDDSEIRAGDQAPQEPIVRETTSTTAEDPVAEDPVEPSEPDATTATTEAPAGPAGTVGDPHPHDHVFEATIDADDGAQSWRWQVIGVEVVEIDPNDQFVMLYDDTGREIERATKVTIRAEYLEGDSPDSLGFALYWKAYDRETRNEVPSAYGSIELRDIYRDALPGGSYEADLLFATEHPEDLILSWEVMFSWNQTATFQSLEGAGPPPGD
jgi:hypothetical protein